MNHDIDKKQKLHHLIHYREWADSGYEKYEGDINPESIWYWMHTYCLDEIDLFFRSILNKSSFLTVGDGHCAREAAHIKRKWGHLVHASDFSLPLIKIAFDKGLIDGYSAQDMNNLGFRDEAFDYVLVKESLHHMSRPYQGLYEMLRVAKKGAVVIEPNGDNDAKYRYNDFEPTGNYMYTFSSHELIKAGIAFGYKYFVVGYTLIFFGYHNYETIKAGKIEEEKQRLMGVDKGFAHPSHKPLLIVLFFRDREIFDMMDVPNKFVRV